MHRSSWCVDGMCMLISRCECQVSRMCASGLSKVVEHVDTDALNNEQWVPPTPRPPGKLGQQAGPKMQHERGLAAAVCCARSVMRCDVRPLAAARMCASALSDGERQQQTCMATYACVRAGPCCEMLAMLLSFCC